MKIIAKCDKCGKDLVCSDYIMTFLGEIIVMVNTDCVCRKCDDCGFVKKLQKELEVKTERLSKLITHNDELLRKVYDAKRLLT